MILLLFLLIFVRHIYGDCIINEDNGKCYEYFPNPTDFMTAETNCKSQGGHLSSVMNAFENSYVNGQAQQPFVKQYDYWIGGTTSENSNWNWTDGMQWRYQNFGTWQYINASGLCTSALVSSGMWLSNPCDVGKPYVCARSTAKTPTTVLTTTAPTQLTPAAGTCNTNSWISYKGNDYCYTCYDDQINGFTWDDSQSACNRRGAHLASIHSPEENFIVNNMTSGFPRFFVIETWIGLYRTAASDYKEFVWSDHTDFDYSNWVAEYPSNINAQCAATYSVGGGDTSVQNKWRDYLCSDYKMCYVCKKPGH